MSHTYPDDPCRPRFTLWKEIAADRIQRSAAREVLRFERGPREQLMARRPCRPLGFECCHGRADFRHGFESASAWNRACSVDLIFVPSTTAPHMDGDAQPTTPKRGLNFARANAKRVAKRAGRWCLWQSEADTIWSQRPRSHASGCRHAGLVSEHTDSIARRVRK